MREEMEHPEITDRTTVRFEDITVTHCVHNTELGFRHWLECTTSENDETLKSDHVGYRFIPFLEAEGRKFFAMTGYFHGSFAIERPLEILEGTVIPNHPPVATPGD